MKSLALLELQFNFNAIYLVSQGYITQPHSLSILKLIITKNNIKLNGVVSLFQSLS